MATLSFGILSKYIDEEVLSVINELIDKCAKRNVPMAEESDK
jgi:uncharacterized protein YejL (UPF0352 family)